MRSILKTAIFITIIIAVNLVWGMLFDVFPAFAKGVKVPWGKGTTGTTSQSGTGGLELIAPNGGEHWEAGVPQIIKWKQAGQKTIDSVSIHYFKRDQKEELVTLRYFFNPLVIEESFTWKIPEWLGDEYESFRVVLRGYKNDALVGEDKSEGYFSITPQGQPMPQVLSVQLSRPVLKVEVSAPNGGEAFKQDKLMMIRWAQKYLNFIDIGLVTKDVTEKTSETEIDWIVKDFKIHPNAGEGIYTWQISHEKGFRDVYYKVYIVGKRSNVGTVSATSNDFFTITKDGVSEVAVQLLEYPRAINHGEKGVFTWNQHNVDAISLLYTAKPINEKSVFTPIVENYPVDTVEGGTAATYEWNVPGPGKIPQGYYAIKLVGYIKNRPIAEDVSRAYLWFGDAKAAEYQGEQPIENADILTIETGVKQISQSAVQIDWEYKAGNFKQDTAAVEYGVTRKYGQSKPFTVSQMLRGAVTLENLTPGAVYYYRIVQGSRATAPATFGIQGAIYELGYTVLKQDKKGMSVKLQWKARSEGHYEVYFCKDVCATAHKERWVKVGETLDNSFVATNDLIENQTGVYWVLRTMPGAFEHGLGARIQVINRGGGEGETAPAPSFTPESLVIKNDALFNRVKGRIVLKIEDSGQAYYISPLTRTAYYLGRPEHAFTIMRSLGIGVTNADLEKIPVGLGQVSGKDTDGDRLSDAIEESLGTDRENQDTDGDGFTDWLELQLNTAPYKGRITLPIDRNFAKSKGGAILIQVEKQGQAWYVNPVDGRRYFLGLPSDAWNIMRNLGVGISNKDFAKL